MSATHTHTGYRPHVGHTYSGSRLYGHRVPKAGRTHALNGGPDVFTALCGEVVRAERVTEYGDPVSWPNVRPAGGTVTCRRCRKALGR